MPPVRSTAFPAFAALLALTLDVAAAPAEAASGSAFDIAAVVEEVKRQLAQVDDGGAATPGRLRIDDAQIDLVLVESLSGKGAALVVPAADYALGTKEETLKPALRRRLVLDIEPGKPGAAAAPSASGSAGSGGGSAGGGGRLAQAVSELRGSVQQAMAADPAFDLRRLTLDLDFAVERDAKGSMQLLVFARDRRIEATNVHGLKLRLAGEGRGREPRPREPRDREPAPR